MNFLKKYYWSTFGLSILALFTNIGLGLIVTSVIILPILIFHFLVGRRFIDLRKYKILIYFSATNLLIFALVRPDGFNGLDDNGLSSILGLLGFNAGFNDKYEFQLAITSLLLMLIQLFTELLLRKFRTDEKDRIEGVAS